MSIQNYITVAELQQSRSQKKMILTGASRFNTKPKTGIAFLEENKLIYTDPNEPRAQSLAVFLKSCARLDKRLLGDFISRPDNIDVLKAYIGLFDFKNVSSNVLRAYTHMLTSVDRNLWPMLCGRCWRHSAYLESLNRSTVSQRLLRRSISHLGQVTPLCPQHNVLLTQRNS